MNSIDSLVNNHMDIDTNKTPAWAPATPTISQSDFERMLREAKEKEAIETGKSITDLIAETPVLGSIVSLFSL